MPLVDVSSVLGGYFQITSDWILGDDRQISGDAQSSVNPPPAGDLGLSDAYFTLKRAYSDTDANAVIQKHITTTLTTPGQITAGLGGALTELLFKISSGDYQALVNAGPVYYWDIRCITNVGGVTFTIARGTVVFLSDVTQTDKAGTPSPFPNSGNPQFRGFVSANPQTISSLNTFFNRGDFFFNSVPTTTSPVGWANVASGAPGTWIPFGGGSGTGSSLILGVTLPFSSSPYTATLSVGWTLYKASASAGADFVFNLPPATGSHEVAVVKKMDANLNHVIAITPNGTDTIDGSNSVVNIAIPNDDVILVDDALGVWLSI